MNVGYYVCYGKGRNAEFPIHLLFNDTDDWPNRIISRRALVLKLSRKATKEEEKVCDSSWRAVSLKYRTFKELIEDEKRVGVSDEFIQLLKDRLLKFLPEYATNHIKDKDIPNSAIGHLENNE